MKTFIPYLIILISLASCGGTKDYLAKANEDKTMFDIVKRLNKKSDDENALKAIAPVYSGLTQTHLDRIKIYEEQNTIQKWDKLYNEYSILQNIYDAIVGSDASSRLVKPISYKTQLEAVRQSGAEAYYQQGNEYMEKGGRLNAKTAYNSFKKADGWIKNYEDVAEKIQQAYDAGIVTIVITPIQDDSYFMNAGWGNTGYNYTNDYFQRNMVVDLGGKYAARYPARFYTDWEAGRDNIQPDWVVDLRLRNMSIPMANTYNYNRNVSKQIQISKDTSGKPIYQTVKATLHIQRQSFTARAQMDVNMVEIATRKNIAYNTFSDTYNWRQETATFSGDKRALSDNDIALINQRFNMPRREDILGQLYRNIYSQTKNFIAGQANW